MICLSGCLQQPEFDADDDDDDEEDHDADEEAAVVHRVDVTLSPDVLDVVRETGRILTFFLFLNACERFRGGGMKSVRHVIGNVHTFTSRFRRDELIRSVCLSVARCVKLQIYSVDDHVLCNIHTQCLVLAGCV